MYKADNTLPLQAIKANKTGSKIYQPHVCLL